MNANVAHGKEGDIPQPATSVLLTVPKNTWLPSQNVSRKRKADNQGPQNILLLASLLTLKKKLKLVEKRLNHNLLLWFLDYQFNFLLLSNFKYL